MSRETMKINSEELESMDEAKIPEQQEQPVPKPKKATVKCSYNVALRKKPNRKGSPLRAVKNGTSVEVLGSAGVYTQVKVDGIVGYIASEFLI